MFILIQIGVYLLYFIVGSLFSNVFLHLVWSFHFTKLPEKHRNTFMGSHIGTAVSALIYLFIGALILALLKYQFGLNLNSLFIFIGVSLVAVNVALRFDKAEKKNS